MKILVICQYYYPEPFRITDICETLVQRGHKVTVLTGLPNYPEGYILEEYRSGKKRNEVINGVNIIRAYEVGRGKSKFKLFLNYLSFSFFASLKALILKDSFDVVFVNQLSPVMMGIPGIIYKRRHHKKMLLYCLDLWPDSLIAGGINKRSLIYKAFLHLSKWVYKSSDFTLITSNMFKQYFEKTLGISSKNIEHLPQYAEDVFSKKIDITRGERTNLVFAGNIGDVQSVETIIHAANEIRDDNGIVIHIVGDGSKLAECKKLVNHFALSNVIFHGRKPVEEMPYYYSIADAMLITLKNNNVLSLTLPGKVQSYMAAGKPIIGAINGEARHVIEEANCGLCCDAEDYKSLAELMKKFLNCHNKDQMGLNAKNYYNEKYNKSQFINRLESLLCSLED